MKKTTTAKPMNQTQMKHCRQRIEESFVATSNLLRGASCDANYKNQQKVHELNAEITKIRNSDSGHWDVKPIGEIKELVSAYGPTGRVLNLNQVATWIPKESSKMNELTAERDKLREEMTEADKFYKDLIAEASKMANEALDEVILGTEGLTAIREFSAKMDEIAKQIPVIEKMREGIKNK